MNKAPFSGTMSLNGTFITRINQTLMCLLGFLIPISTAGTNLLIGLIFFGWIVENIPDRFRRTMAGVKANPVSIMGLVVVCMYLAGIVYTAAGHEKIAEHLSDSAKFLFIPMMGLYAADKKVSRNLMRSFFVSMAFILVLSYLFWLNLLPDFFPVKMSRQSHNFVIFHDHIKQNNFMAFFFFIAAVRGFFEKKWKNKILFWALSFLAFFNVLYLVQGKTGKVIAIVLFFYFLSIMGRKKQIVLVLTFLLGLGSIWMAMPKSDYNRVRIAADEIKAWKYGTPADSRSSSGLRLEWYTNTVKLIAKNPMIGTGTGSFQQVYNEFIKTTQMSRTDNPHNDFLMTAVQFGTIGLIIFICFFGVQWIQAGCSGNLEHALISRGFILVMLSACMFSSPIQDSAEGWFFAYMSVALFSSPAFAGERPQVRAQ